MSWSLNLEQTNTLINVELRELSVALHCRQLHPEQLRLFSTGLPLDNENRHL